MVATERMMGDDQKNDTLANIAIIVLAAGSSTRMGRPKQLLPFRNGTLLSHAIETTIASGAQHIAVVLGSEIEKSRTILQQFPVEVVVNDRWQTGMGSSLKEGLTFVQKQVPRITGVIVMVCDQPLISADHLCQLAKKVNSPNTALVATRYADTFGVPAFFHASLFPALQTISDHEGAKRFIQQHRERTEFVDFENAEIDLDTPEDYANFSANQST